MWIVIFALMLSAGQGAPITTPVMKERSAVAEEFNDLNSNVYFSSGLYSPSGGGYASLLLGSTSTFAMCSISYHRMDSAGVPSTGEALGTCRTSVSGSNWYLYSEHTSATADIYCQAVCMRQTAFSNGTRNAWQYAAYLTSEGSVSLPVRDCYLTTIELMTEHQYHCGGLCNGCQITTSALYAYEDNRHDAECGSYCANQNMASYNPIPSLRGHDGVITQPFSGDYDFCYLSYVYRGDGSCAFGCPSTYNYCRLQYSSSSGWSLTAASNDNSDTYDILCGVRCLNAVD